MKIWLFENVWRVVQWFVRRGKGDIQSHAKRMIWQLKLAKIFGGFKAIVIGDSNAENLNTYSKRTRLSEEIGGLFLNIGVGGTRADSWVGFFLGTDDGREVYKLILENFNKHKTMKVLFNIGGNNILQKQMEVAEGNLKKLYQLFPMSYNCLVPPVHLELIEQISLGTYTRRELLDGVSRINDIIKTYWTSNTIDTFTPFLDINTREAYLFVLEDAVHFSDICDEKMRIPLILNKMKFGV